MYFNTREIRNVVDDDVVIYLTFSEALTIVKSKENEENCHKHGISKVYLKINLFYKLFNTNWQQWSKATQFIMQMDKI